MVPHHRRRYWRFTFIQLIEPDFLKWWLLRVTGWFWRRNFFSWERLQGATHHFVNRDISIAKQQSDRPSIFVNSNDEWTSYCIQMASTSPLSHLTAHMTPSQRDTMFTKIFVGGLPYHTTDESLRNFFQVRFLWQFVLNFWSKKLCERKKQIRETRVLKNTISGGST